MKRRAAMLGALVLAGCALDEIWIGSVCPERDVACEAREGGAREADAPEGGCACDVCPCPDGAASGCPTGRFALDVRATYAASPSGVCFLTGPSEKLETSGTWFLTLKAVPVGADEAELQGCIRVPGQGEDAGPGDIDWRATIRGRMRCDTGAFEGELRATYNVVSVCTLGQIATRYYAKGPISARYDARTQRFEDGQMEMREPPVLLGEVPGGNGVWSGARAVGPYDPDVDTLHCLGAAFRDDLFRAPSPGDAGTPEPSDGGAPDAEASDAQADAAP